MGRLLPTAAADRQRLRLTVAIGMMLSTLAVAPAPWLVYRKLVALLAMVCCALSYVPPIAVLWSRRPRLISAVQVASTVVSCAGFSAFVYGTGGSSSSAVAGFFAMPLVLGMLSLETPLVSVVAGAVLGVLGCAMWSLEGKSVGDTIMIAAGSPIMGLVGAYGSFLYRRGHAAELEALEERALLQRRSAEADRLAMLGRLVAGVAHEINNPLAFVTSNVNFVSQTLTQKDQEIGEALTEASEGLRRIQNIVNDLSALSRPVNQPEERCDVTASIETAVRIASVKAKGIAHFNIEAPPHDQTLAMSSSRLVQVILNLLINAIDAIETDRQRATQGTVWIQLTKGKLVIADDGPGIASEALERIFEPFFTTKPRGKGIGLGLALCKQYLSERGYTICVDGRPGGGARFTVQFSAAGATPTTAS